MVLALVPTRPRALPPRNNDVTVIHRDGAVLLATQRYTNNASLSHVAMAVFVPNWSMIIIAHAPLVTMENDATNLLSIVPRIHARTAVYVVRLLPMVSISCSETIGTCNVRVNWVLLDDSVTWPKARNAPAIRV